MTNKRFGVLLLFVLLVSFGVQAQRATSMRINEVLVINDDNFVDDWQTSRLDRIIQYFCRFG